MFWIILECTSQLIFCQFKLISMWFVRNCVRVLCMHEYMRKFPSKSATVGWITFKIVSSEFFTFFMTKTIMMIWMKVSKKRSERFLFEASVQFTHFNSFCSLRCCLLIRLWWISHVLFFTCRHQRVNVRRRKKRCCCKMWKVRRRFFFKFPAI